ncbi:DUF4244 domain-containing protein [Streptosporangium sp. NPDC002544]|uniref:DUF4244 domain-containing protein n=1 Tax=Streptosporangium sp. NPDC002544 TaxID=3154538 RepID=UPI0033184C31
MTTGARRDRGMSTAEYAVGTIVIWGCQANLLVSRMKVVKARQASRPQHAEHGGVRRVTIRGPPFGSGGGPARAGTKAPAVRPGRAVPTIVRGMSCLGRVRAGE